MHEHPLLFIICPLSPKAAYHTAVAEVEPRTGSDIHPIHPFNLQTCFSGRKISHHVHCAQATCATEHCRRNRHRTDLCVGRRHRRREEGESLPPPLPVMPHSYYTDHITTYNIHSSRREGHLSAFADCILVVSNDTCTEIIA